MCDLVMVLVMVLFMVMVLVLVLFVVLAMVSVLILVMVIQNIGTWALSRETYFSFTQSSSIASKILENPQRRHCNKCNMKDSPGLDGWPTVKSILVG